MKGRHFSLLIIFLCSTWVSSWAVAAGFIDHKNGSPYRWKKNPIVYRVDPGPAKDGVVSNVQAKALLREVLDTWESVPVAAGLKFVEGDNLPVDITKDNYKDYVRLSPLGIFENVGSSDENYVIFDADGGILNDMLKIFGDGQASSILGIGTAGRFDTVTGEIKAGFIIINGSISSVDATSIKATMIHEMGHFLNLAHSQLNVNASDESFLPTMHPFLPDDPSVLFDLHRDDEFSLSLLYPDAAALAGRGALVGKIVRRGGAGVRAVNVICRNDDAPQIEAVSFISDIYHEGTGGYQCGHLPAGPYTVAIEPIIVAINTYSPIPPYVPGEFYSGSSESFDPTIDDRSASTAVDVSLGSRVDDIDIVINEDGRLLSGVPVNGQTVGDFSSLNYFITVPPQAKSVVFELQASNDDQDMDLYGRCGGEFSLALDTAPRIYDEDSGVKQQSEFAGVSFAGEEKITLSASSSPALRACTYHLLVRNFSVSSSAQIQGFTLKATIDGSVPVLSVSDAAGATNPNGSGEVPILFFKMNSRGDTAVVRSIVMEDRGNGSMNDISTIRLYRDVDNDRQLSDQDVLLSDGLLLSGQARTFKFDSLDVLVEPERDHFYIVTYIVEPNSAKLSWFVALSILTLMALALIDVNCRQLGVLFLIGVLLQGVPLQLSCGSHEAGKYQIVIDSADRVDAVGLAFGDAMKVDASFGQYQSVKDFFD